MTSVSKDMFLTSEEAKLLEESYRHEQEGKLISNKGLRKKLVQQERRGYLNRVWESLK